MKNENKIVFILNIISSVCFYISAILGFESKSDMAVINFCLGSCFLCLAVVNYSKYKKDKEKEDKEGKNED